MSVAPEIIRWSLNMNREFYWMVHIYCWDHNRSNFNKTRLTLSWNIDPCPLAKAGMAISLAESHAFTTLPAGRLWGEALGPGKPLGNHWEIKEIYGNLISEWPSPKFGTIPGIPSFTWPGQYVRSGSRRSRTLPFDKGGTAGAPSSRAGVPFRVPPALQVGMV